MHCGSRWSPTATVLVAPWRRPWWWNQPPGQPVSCTLLYEQEPPAQAGGFFCTAICRSGAACLSQVLHVAGRIRNPRGAGASEPLFRPRISHIRR